MARAAQRGRQMEIFWWIFVGLIAGALGKFIMPGRDPGGFVVTILIGIAGAVLAGYVSQMLGISEPGGTSSLWKTIIGATMGSIVLLVLYRLIMAGRTRH
jgi:uncharacterized membrane protein YeaQ/YmgE (transglycosylase-associated protein family)